MARAKVSFRGQTARKRQDGDCRAIVNLRPTREGIYKPVAPRRELKKLTRTYNHMFVHKGSTYENRIGIVGNKIYVNVEESNELLYQTVEVVNSIEQIGNLVILICDSTTNHLLWADGGYRFLGELPESPIISYSTDETSLSLTLKEGDGINEPYKDSKSWLGRVRATLYRTQELITNGGQDGVGTTHSAQGQYLFDAHIMQYAYRLYDGTLTKYSPPILLMPSTPISEIKRMTSAGMTEAMKVKTTGYRPIINAKAWYNSHWKDIIKSVDIFISPSLQMSSIERMIDPEDAKLTTEESRGKVLLVKQDKEHNLKSVEDCGTLYLLKSIPYESGTNNQTITLLRSKEEEDAIKNLQFGELLPVDTGSNHSLGAKVSYVYNNRLHLANIKTTLFNGYNPLFFSIDNAYNGSASLLRPAGGGTSIGRSWNEFTCYVTINLNGREEIVTSSYHSPTWISNFNVTSMISYPDIRAKRMKITAGSSLDEVVIICDVALTAHKYLNIAYHIDGDLKALGERYSIDSTTAPTPSPVIDYELNKLKVSSINNPFNYPNSNAYLIGNSEILTIASQAQKISEGSFGQYPLFLFTTTGIYSLQIGAGEVLYSNQVAPVSYETPVSKIIAETPYGIVFVSKRGLCNISGQQVELISDSIDQEHQYLKIHDNKIDEANYPDDEFEEYLSSVRNIIYNPYHDEIIISANKDYCYVYNIPTKSFWLSTEDIMGVVRNTFPELHIISSNALKTMGESREKSVRVAIITHPIDFGTPDIKKMERALLRGLLAKANVGEINSSKPIPKMLIGVYNSLDEVNFNMSRGIMLQQDGNYKDVDMGLMARTKSRYFLLVIAGTISEGSTISGVDFEIVEEYNNYKMR